MRGFKKTIYGDITEQEPVDVICNAANGIGCMLAGVSGRIGRRAGIKVQFESMVSALWDLHLAGSIYSSGAGKLQCKEIVHLVTMFLPGTWSTQKSVEKCLKALTIYCQDYNYKTVLLPFIGCGTGMVNHEKVASTYYGVLSAVPDITFIVCDKNNDLIQLLNKKLDR